MKHFCREASQLASDAYERDLGFIERLRLRLHLAMCSMCRNYARNLNLLHKIFSRIRREDADARPCLPDNERKRIEKTLKQTTQSDP